MVADIPSAVQPSKQSCLISRTPHHLSLTHTHVHASLFHLHLLHQSPNLSPECGTKCHLFSQNQDSSLNLWPL